VFLRRAKRTDARRAVLVLFGGWLILTALAFSFMAGIFHAYYTVALAPPLAAVVAIGAAMLWKRRAKLWARIVSAVLVLCTAALAYGLLVLSAEWMPWLKFAILGLAVVAAVLLLLPPRGRALAGATIAVTLVGALLAPAAYSLETVTVGHTGSIVTAGPSVTSSGGFGSQRPGGNNHVLQNGTPPALPGGTPGARPRPGAGVLGALGGVGGLLGAATVTDQVKALLSADAGDYRWVAAAIGSNNAAGYQLATQHSVMPVGGFNGSDPSPTLAQFRAWVATGDIHYFIAGEIGRPNGGSDESGDIQTWVAANFVPIKLDGLTLYDLTE
jgi:4-amino-4-deoxy-L-arabinose transferase-like glycosyltransferase